MAKLKISEMTGKLAGVAGINTNPLTNSFCQKKQLGNSICKDCYSCAMLRGIRKNCEPAWERNSVLLSTTDLEASDIPYIPNALVRFHAHGELINKRHFRNFIRIAEANPQSKFSFFTKRTELCELTSLPANVTMVYSNPTINRVRNTPPKGFHKVFNVVTKDGYEINCGAKNCSRCQQCFNRGGSQVMIEKLKKRG